MSINDVIGLPIRVDPFLPLTRAARDAYNQPTGEREDVSYIKCGDVILMHPLRFDELVERLAQRLYAGDTATVRGRNGKGPTLPTWSNATQAERDHWKAAARYISEEAPTQEQNAHDGGSLAMSKRMHSKDSR